MSCLEARYRLMKLLFTTLQLLFGVGRGPTKVLDLFGAECIEDHAASSRHPASCEVLLPQGA